MSNKAPSYQYYPKDWRADAVFTCSLAARGLWREMLDMMHAQERYGYLAHNGVPIPSEGIARYCGCSPDEYETLLAELFRAGVPSRTSEGIIYSRRMIKDEKARAIWRKEQEKHRDTKNKRQEIVNAMSTLSSSASSSASPLLKPNTNTKAPPLYFAGMFLRIDVNQNQRLCEVYGSGRVNDCYSEADLWLEANPQKRRKNHFAFMRNWLSRQKNPPAPIAAKQQAAHVESHVGTFDPSLEAALAAEERNKREMARWAK